MIIIIRADTQQCECVSPLSCLECKWKRTGGICMAVIAGRNSVDAKQDSVDAEALADILACCMLHKWVHIRRINRAI